MAPKERTRTTLATVLLAVLVLFAANLGFSEDFKTTHTFQAGDIVSADVFNELFRRIENSTRTITVSDLLGRWACDAVAAAESVPGGILSDWKLSTEALYRKLSAAQLTFKDDGDGTFSLSTSSPDPFVFNRSQAHESPIELAANTLYYKYQVDGSSGAFSGAYRLKKISDSRLIFEFLLGGSYNPQTLICDKADLPPAIPADLVVARAGLKATLTWVDKSGNETGFKVLRKDSLTGTFSVVFTTQANGTTYEDTAPQAGSYWYRVVATNQDGDSLGSNEVTVDLVE